MTVDGPGRERRCKDCGTPTANLPVIDTFGGFHGWRCEECDRRRRRRRMGWRRRFQRQVARWLNF
jgi:hypothetical protein